MTTEIFLSASFPEDDRVGEFGTQSPQDIGLAVTAVVSAVLQSPDGHLVFGGHPTISPLVLNLATQLEVRDRVTIYHSTFFEDSTTNEVKRLIKPDKGRAFAELIWTEGDVSTQDKALQSMRTEMMARPLRAAFFVGGMIGIAYEYGLFAVAHPYRPRFLFSQPGGTTALLAGDPPVDDVQALRPTQPTYALDGLGYDWLVSQAWGLVQPG